MGPRPAVHAATSHIVKTLQNGAIYSNEKTGCEFIVLEIDPDARIAVVARLGTKSCRPRIRDLDDLNAALQSEQLTLVVEEGIPDELPEQLVELHSPAAAKRFNEKIRPALELLIAPGWRALAQNTLWSRITSAATQYGLSAWALNAAFSKVAQAGGRLTAARPKWHRSGRCGSSVSTNGMLAVATQQPGAYPLSVPTIQLIQRFVRTQMRPGVTWRELHDEFLKKHFQAYKKRSRSTRSCRGEEIIITKPEGKRPSFQQFYRHGCKLVPLADRIAASVGKHDAAVNHRGSPNGAAVGAVLPGMVAEIDWTISDIVAVKRDNRLTIGRLIIYAIADQATGQILAAYMTMYNGRFDEAARAILQCLENKVDLCARYDLRIESDDWDVHHLFNELVCDKGEIDSLKANPLITGLDIHVETTPTRRPDLKGTVESFFAVLRWFLRRMRGATCGHWERTKKDPRVTAVYDFHQIYKMILALVVKLNGRVRRRECRTTGMIAQKLPKVPRAMWQWAKESGCLREVPYEIARMQLLPAARCKVTSMGIAVSASVIRSLNIRGVDQTTLEEDTEPDDKINPDPLYYSLPNESTAREAGFDPAEWLVRARKRRFAVDVGIDPSTVDHIWLRHCEPGKAPVMLQCNLARDCARAFHGLGLAEYWKLGRQLKRGQRSFLDDQERDRRWLDSIIQGVTSEAKKATDAVRANMSDAELKKGIAANRADEIEQQNDPTSEVKYPESTYDEHIEKFWTN